MQSGRLYGGNIARIADVSGKIAKVLDTTNSRGNFLNDYCLNDYCMSKSKSRGKPMAIDSLPVDIIPGGQLSRTTIV